MNNANVKENREMAKNKPCTLYSIRVNPQTIEKILQGELPVTTPVGNGREPDADGTYDEGGGDRVTVFLGTARGTQLPVINTDGSVKLNLRRQTPPPPAEPPAPEDPA